jgi:hypothetical protein
MGMSRFKIIYGVVWPDLGPFREITPDSVGFENLYTSSGPNTGYCGVELADVGWGENLLVSKLAKLQPTLAQKAKTVALLEQARVALKEVQEEDEDVQRIIKEWDYSNLVDCLEATGVWLVWYNS